MRLDITAALITSFLDGHRCEDISVWNGEGITSAHFETHDGFTGQIPDTDWPVIAWKDEDLYQWGRRNIARPESVSALELALRAAHANPHFYCPEKV